MLKLPLVNGKLAQFDNTLATPRRKALFQGEHSLIAWCGLYASHHHDPYTGPRRCPGRKNLYVGRCHATNPSAWLLVSSLAEKETGTSMHTRYVRVDYPSAQYRSFFSLPQEAGRTSLFAEWPVAECEISGRLVLVLESVVSIR